MTWERPVAQVVVYGSRNPNARADVERRLRDMGGAVWTREPHWVIGAFPLPGSEPDSDRYIHHGLAFVEGRDRMEEAYGADAPERVVKLAERTSTIAQLPGDFTFAHVDGDTVRLVRSCAGMGHWFTYHGRDFVMATTRLRLFEDVLEAEMELDELVLAVSTADSLLPWNRTTLAGVSVVPPAHALELRLAVSTSPCRYWEPAEIEPARRPCDTGERAGQMRDIVIGALRRDLSNAAPNVVTFSGGVDSCVVAALSKRLGFHTETVSLMPMPDAERAEIVINSISTFLDVVDVDKHWPHGVDEPGWSDVLMSSPAMRVPVMNPSLILGARHGISSGATVMSGGENADELFGGWNTLYKAWVSSLTGGDLARSLLTARGLNRKKSLRIWMIPRIARNHVRLPFRRDLAPYIRQDLHEQYAAFVTEKADEFRRTDHPRAFLINQLAHYSGWLLQSWEICSNAGMRRSLPFHSRESIELAMATHPLDLAWPPKKLLRAAFDGLVPASHLHRVEKDTFGSSPRADRPTSLGCPLPEVVTGIIRPGWLDLSGPVHPDVAMALAPVAIAAQRPVADRPYLRQRR